MRHTTATLLCLSWATVAQTQPAAAVPKLVRFNGSFRPAGGMPLQSMESLTLSVYRDQTGGDALWHEIQNVVMDPEGHYSVLMGATVNEGMPLDLFTSGEQRWMGVQFNRPGEAEQPRVLLVSVPYALKAADADTLGGRPASAYLLAAPTDSHVPGALTGTSAAKPKSVLPASSGLPNYIGKFANTIDLVDSAMYEVNGNVGIATTQPAIALDVRTGALPQMGIAGTTDYLTFFASDQYGPAIYWDPAKDMRFGKGGSGLYNPYGFVEQMRIVSSNGRVGIGTQTPGAKLDVAGAIALSGDIVLRVPGGNNTNIAVGVSALPGGSGGYNVATGNNALSANSSGAFNTADGAYTLANNTTGLNNTALGYAALTNNTTGQENIAIGSFAAFEVAGGKNSNIHIGSDGAFNDDSVIRMGTLGVQSKFFAAGVRGVTTGNNNAIPVLIDSNGQLGTVSSSRRFKEDIQDMGSASQDLMRLRPVTYRYKEPFADGSKPIQFGLIAEEVSEVYPDLVAHSAAGRIETVKYQVLDSMLLNEVQRQQAEIGAQKNRIRRLEERLAQMGAQLEAVLATLSNGSSNGSHP